MERQFLGADVIFDGKGNALENHILIMNDEGVIDKLVPANLLPDSVDVQFYSGGLCPGFINTHCHLELSHMKELVDTGTTLLPFLQSVVKYRNFPDEVIQVAIHSSDQFMYEQGIVAVGDISNKTDTVEVKSKSKIKYYTFVEMFDFMQPSMTSKIVDQYTAVYKEHAQGNFNKKSYVPHAPYTVTKGLFHIINDLNDIESVVSIHNQETQEENDMFLSGKSGFIDFFKTFGFNMDDFMPTNTRSIDYALRNMIPTQKTIFVHNTTSIPSDIEAAHKWGEEVYWATCPNANLYIENKLPNYQFFASSQAKMTIGTDSLTSNWQLSISSEILTLQKFCSFLSLPQLIQWATLHGAEALGFDDTLGSFDPSKKPGVNLLNVLKTNKGWRLLDDQVTKIS